MNKTGTQRIETHRLILRPFRIEDADDAFNIFASATASRSASDFASEVSEAEKEMPFRVFAPAENAASMIAPTLSISVTLMARVELAL